ncbi:MAG: hypothetical protein ACKVQA_23195, partial [Burkholderiales bacterium]
MTRLIRNLGPVWMVRPLGKLIRMMTVGLVAASATLALAATSSPLPSAAREFVDKGMSADKNQDHLAAIGHFREALRIAPNAPELLFYLGVEESKVPGRELRAVAWLGAYLSLRADGPGAAKAKDNIGKLILAHRKALLRLIASVENAARFTERKGPSLRDFARKLAQTGDFTSALQIAANLKDLPESQTEAYAAIAKVQAAAWDITGALKTASMIAGSQPMRDEALLDIVTFQIVRDRAGALDTIARIQDSGSKDRAMRIVSYFQARTGDVAGALGTAEAIQDEEIKGAAR